MGSSKKGLIRKRKTLIFAEIGLLSLILVFALGLIPGCLVFYCFHSQKAFWVMQTTNRAILQILFVLSTLAFGALIACFLITDLSVVSVLKSSSTQKPTLYKIAGVWGSHEGSMMLWVWSATLFGFWLSWVKMGANLKLCWSVASALYSLLISSFAAYILFFSNPFERSEDFMLEGMGLNPVLQDPSLAIHPPLLYLGYLGLGVVFVLTLSGLITKRLNGEWVELTYPFLLVSWCFLGTGIILGSFWAYYELGWGGYWFWDPVENIALIPWLFATLMIHALRGSKHQLLWPSFTALLGLLGFFFVLVGTFFVRSGLLNSVHSFAVDENKSTFLLALLLLWGGGSVVVYLLYGFGQHTKKFASHLFSRINMLLFQNIFLFWGTFMVIVGTFYPLVHYYFTHQTLAVGPRYYALTFCPIMLFALSFACLTPYLEQEKSKRSNAFKLGLSLIFACALALWIKGNFWGSLGIIVGSSLILSHLLGSKESKNKPMILAHVGAGIIVVSVSLVSLLKSERVLTLKINDMAQFEGHTFHLAKVDNYDGPNYHGLKAYLEISKGKKIGVLTPEKRLYPLEKQTTYEVSLYYKGFSHFYAVLGGFDSTHQTWTIRLSYYPYIALIWLGGLLIVLAGLLRLVMRQR
jgi:cytochrome c-type biogenesis protein CcmF